MRNFAVMLVLLFILSGCSRIDNSVVAASTGEDAVVLESFDDGNTYDGFVFSSNGVDIKLGVLADETLTALGDAKKYFEAPSCAFEGVDKTYYYNGFELTTFPNADKDYILSVTLTDDSVTTNEGVYIGDSIDSVIAAYGDDYTEDMGQYTYMMGNTSLSFLIENDEVSLITYLAITK